MLNQGDFCSKRVQMLQKVLHTLQLVGLFGHRQRYRIGVHRALGVADLAAVLVTVHGRTYIGCEGGLVVVGAACGTILS